jgi:hypothetical protein
MAPMTSPISTFGALALLAQRDAADDEGAGLVGQQVDEDRLARLQHAAHLRVGDHVFHHVAHELVDRREAQRRQEAPVALVDPHDASAAVDQEHALADAGKQMKHRARGERKNALGVEGQGGRCGGCGRVGGCGACADSKRASIEGKPALAAFRKCSGCGPQTKAFIKP